MSEDAVCDVCGDSVDDGDEKVIIVAQGDVNRISHRECVSISDRNTPEWIVGPSSRTYRAHVHGFQEFADGEFKQAWCGNCRHPEEDLIDRVRAPSFEVAVERAFGDDHADICAQCRVSVRARDRRVEVATDGGGE